MKKVYRYRCSITGRYVSALYALAHPETTQKFEVKPRGADCNHPRP